MRLMRSKWILPCDWLNASTSA
uniref:Uncharacterized protein n=1 Tax=Anguilla anguilla TaxID=7936 RepID=A0A0E9QAS7_ANGAN